MTKQEKLELINYYKHHSNVTGFLEWKDNTPDYVKQLEEEMTNELFEDLKWDWA